MPHDSLPETFDELTWGEPSERSRLVSRHRALEGGTYLAWLVVVAYAYFPKPDRVPSIAQIGLELDAVDWLFLLTFLLGFYRVVLPLYRNKRMTAHYWRQFRKNRVAVGSLGFLVFVFFVGAVGPMVIAPPSIDLSHAYQPPVGITASPVGTETTGTWVHPLGTDHQGQDMLTLVIYGMRVSMQVGLISMVVAVSIGTLVGTTAAFFGGYVDEVLMRYVDLQQTFPAFILLLLLVYLFGSSLLLIIVLYGFLSWEGTARLVRSETLQRREEAYIIAAESAGASRSWIIRRHLIPNVSSTVITVATLSIPGFILGEAALSFLELGDPNTYSWGKVIANGRNDLAIAPWVSTIPGVFLFLTVLAFNFVGDALRDAIDPRQDSSS